MSLSDRIFGEEDWQEIPLGFIKSSDVQEAVNELKAINHNCVCDAGEIPCDFCKDLIRVFGEKLC